jgi:hypothetical protein
LNAIKKDVTHPETGRDLVLTINRNQNGIPVVSAVASLDPSPLSEDKEQAAAWLADARTWEDVYSVRSYDYLAIIVKGGTPVWDKENKCFVDKATLADSSDEATNLESELTMGVENVKSNIVTSSAPEGEMSTPEDDGDDLPF